MREDSMQLNSMHEFNIIPYADLQYGTLFPAQNF